MQAPASSRPGPKAEQIILFRVSGVLLAISSASVQEVRSVESLAGISQELPHSGVRKARHAIRRGDRPFYVVNGAVHFGLPPAPSSLVFVLRNTRTALLVDGIEKMTSITRLQALSHAFCHEERRWYRGLTSFDQIVVPVVNPDGFLSFEEQTLLDEAFAALNATRAAKAIGEEAPA